MLVDLVLVGFGNVGRRFARLLGERRDRLRDIDGLECRVVGIATRTSGVAFDPGGIDADAAAALVESGGRLEDLGDRSAPPCRDALDLIARAARAQGAAGGVESAATVLVESTTLDIRDGRPAIDHVEAALDAGFDVVTANKGPAAFAYDRLDSRARAAGRSFLFEGAVMDGVPVFNLVRETLPTSTSSASAAWSTARPTTSSPRSKRASHSTRHWPGCRLPASRRPTRHSTSTGGMRQPRRPRSRTS